MGEVIGVAGREHPDAEALGFRKIVAGRFVMQQVSRLNPLPKHQIRQIPTAHECPYCHEPLCRLDPASGSYTGRVITTGRHGALIIDPLPPEVIPLKCLSCDVHFSVLSEKPMSRFFAVDPVGGSDREPTPRD